MCGGGFAVGVWECAFDWWAKLFLQVLKQITGCSTPESAAPKEREAERNAAPTALLPLTLAWLGFGSWNWKNICSFPLLHLPKAEPWLWSVKDGHNTKVIKVMSFGDSKMGSFSRKRNLATYYLIKYSHYCSSFDLVAVVFQEVFLNLFCSLGIGWRNS